MQQLELFTSLPTCLSCSILRDWLNVKSVIALNSAFCCKSHREVFLDLLRSDEYFIPETVTITSNSRVFTVLQLFGKKLRSIAFNQKLDFEQARSLITNCTELTHINLRSREGCTPALWGIFKANTRLESLNISVSHTVSFKDVMLPRLSTLVLRGCRISGKGFLNLMKAGHIVRLDLSYSAFIGSVLLQIAQLCSNLTNLGTASSLFLNDQILIQITALCPHIAHLDISSNSQLTDNAIKGVVQNLKGLQSLSIGGKHTILTDASLVYLYTHCATTLHTLEIECTDGLPSFSSDAVNELLVCCTQLRTFYFSDEKEDEEDPYIGHTQVNFSPASVKNLTMLILTGPVVHEQNIATIGKYGCKVELLSLYQCYSYTCESFKSLFKGCPKLRKLSLSLEYDIGFHEQSGNANIYELSLFALDLWKELRPGLVVETNARLLPSYNVLEM